MNLTLPEYVKAVKKIHEMDHNTTWRDLGTPPKAATPSSPRSTPRPHQALSGSSKSFSSRTIPSTSSPHPALKEEFAAYYKEFEKAFKSLTITQDLINNVPQPERREKLKASIAGITIQNLHTLEKMLGKEFADMGLHWQFLMLQSALQNSAASK